MKHIITKLIICLALLTSIQAKSQLIDTSFINSYDSLNYFYTFKENILTQDINQISSPVLRTSKDFNLRLFKSSSDELGFNHYKYYQYFNNVIIDGSEFIVHTNKLNESITANGKLYDNISTNFTPSINSRTAINNAINYSNAKKFMWQDFLYENRLKEDAHNKDTSYYPKAILVLKNISNNIFQNNFRLCFKIRIYTTIPFDTYDLFVDAVTGKIVYKNQIATKNCFATTNNNRKEPPINNSGQISFKDESQSSPLDAMYACANPCNQGNANLDYYGSQYINTDRFKYLGVCTHRAKNTCTSTYLYVRKANHNDYRDQTNNWTDGNDKPGTTSLWCLERTHDFYRYTYGRNSFDGNSAQVNLYAEDVSMGAGYSFWNGNEIHISKTGGQFTDDQTTLDIIGHEFTHGVNDYEANLTNQGESGALDESFADIFGKMIDFYAKTNYSTGLTPNYILHQECSNGGNRNMANPNNKNHPDTYGGSYWVNPSSTTDNGGVHINSGVQNFWFYLLAEGGNGTNDLGNLYCVLPIGRDKAAKIAYRNLTTYLVSTSNFSNARFYSIQSAIDLFGAGSNEVAQVTTAWYAVGIGNSYSGSIIISNHTATGVESYHYNNKVSIVNFISLSGSNVIVTSNIEIQILPEVSALNGTNFNAYITPTCP